MPSSVVSILENKRSRAILVSESVQWSRTGMSLLRKFGDLVGLLLFRGLFGQRGGDDEGGSAGNLMRNRVPVFHDEDLGEDVFVFAVFDVGGDFERDFDRLVAGLN